MQTAFFLYRWMANQPTRKVRGMWIKYVYASGRDHIPETSRQGFHVAGEWLKDFICALKRYFPKIEKPPMSRIDVGGLFRYFEELIKSNGLRDIDQPGHLSIFQAQPVIGS